LSNEFGIRSTGVKSFVLFIAGILREAAVELVSRCFKGKRPEEVSRFIVEGLRSCLQNGLTSVQTNDEDAIDTYLTLQEQSQLPIRVFLTPTQQELLSRDRPLCPLLPRMLTESDAQGDLASGTARLSVDRMKIFADGSLGAETAALRTSYVHLERGDSAPENTGLLIHDDHHLEQMVRILPVSPHLKPA
jgi:predicted amidohydrolase YtcJ